MGYKNYIEKTFDSYKCKSKTDEYRTIPIYDGDRLAGFLKPLTYLYKLLRPTYIDLICQWREENPVGFANRFPGTPKKTENWIDNILLPREDRILFMVHALDNTPIGHLGFSSFDYVAKSCEIDNVVRGKKEFKGLLSLATKTLIDWGKRYLGLQEIYLKVLSDNSHAITFYERLGFKEQDRIPLFRIEHHDMIEWLPLDEHEELRPDKYFIVMKLCQ
jgi:RimJ/RimL family protein N-acetyltransferase